MDGSFLSDDQVVAASREYICIRLATYEDKRETEFLRQVFTGRSGALENTVFAILAADGSRPIVRPGRGPFFAFEDADDMAKQMKSLLPQHAGQRGTFEHTELPAMKNVDLALNVAACDQLPVIVIVAADAESRRALEKKLLSSAWEETLAGQFVYAYATDKSALAPIADTEMEHGIWIVEPGPFGMSGQVVERFGASATAFDVKRGMLRSMKSRKPTTKDYQAHIRIGSEMGLDWETQVPVTDQQSLQAKERYRARRQLEKGANP